MAFEVPDQFRVSKIIVVPDTGLFQTTIGALEKRVNELRRWCMKNCPSYAGSYQYNDGKFAPGRRPMYFCFNNPAEATWFSLVFNDD